MDAHERAETMQRHTVAHRMRHQIASRQEADLYVDAAEAARREATKITPAMIEAGARELRGNPRWPRDMGSYDVTEAVIKAALGVES